VSLIDGTRRNRPASDVDRVSKRFYDRYKTEHTHFAKFIKGITKTDEREWYASLMLNRLMFLYFLQKRGFLDSDVDYLGNRMRMVREQNAKDGLVTFYRSFLLRLFHEGLAQPRTQRKQDLRALLGEVPSLNGSLFDVHELEDANPKIQIADEAFEHLFTFFDAYEWHLDVRPLRADNEINPDVLGYIFERYVNQKQMGAYYTKEDITGYIARNTIIPFLFDAAEKIFPSAFRPGSPVWRRLRDDPDRYIYPAVGHSIFCDVRQTPPRPLPAPLPLPPAIADGAADATNRKAWNTAAPPEYALPTETWREVVARREHCQALQRKLRAGEVNSINDVVTYNLDICRFARDVLGNSENAELVHAFWEALQNVSVLDPTCGSGAFLFAALSVLEPLNEASLARMQTLLQLRAGEGAQPRSETLAAFRETLETAARHPNRRHFILKSIIVNNLYGVDIMEEAVEICKLRLFLKLVAQVDTANLLEPLPDIDFNIRAGNTLVGFTSLHEVKKTLQGNLALGRKEVDRIADEAQAVAASSQRLDSLRDKLDRFLAAEYGIAWENSNAYSAWRESHQPFHWFAEFYGVMSRGSFDAIIGNPPYISAAKTRAQYRLLGYKTATCPDTYANIQERCLGLLSPRARCGMIVPLSVTFARDFQSLRNLLLEEYSQNWFSSYGRIPDSLFSADVRVRNTIHLAAKAPGSELRSHYSSVLHRWFEAYRPFLLAALRYAAFEPAAFDGLIPKVNTQALSDAMTSLATRLRGRLGDSLSPGPTRHVIHFKKTAYNWLAFCKKLPQCFDSEGRSIAHTKFGEVWVNDPDDRNVLLTFLNGKIMFAYWCMIGDDFDVTRWMFAEFPLTLSMLTKSQRDRLVRAGGHLEQCMRTNRSFKLNAGKRVGNYNLARCRVVTDQTDAIFAEALGLSEVWEDIELMYAQVVKTGFEVRNRRAWPNRSVCSSPGPPAASAEPSSAN
jgi:hypothetical protein